ncbi:MAG TPA: alginate lyase family protein [Bryobacteraceae bacterium]|nr:alginate lyase family protein [Bryobacteraceae bacterium]
MGSELTMRSPQEIAFRLRQEMQNLRVLAFPPRPLRETSWPLPGLPAAACVGENLRNTEFASRVLDTADQILAHRFPLLGITIETGPDIQWRRDYVNQRSTDAKYFRLIPYLDLSRAGDHKNIWELNRHQHLVLLAQAFLFSNRAAYLNEIVGQLNSWWAQNPFQRGINWTSALEVAFRAFSWLWTYHLVGNHMEPAFRKRFLESLYRHGCHIETNLSFYFSPNTHLLGEAVALHALGHLFPSFPRASHWAQLGSETVLREAQRQVREDGSHFEQSTYYHVYALDMFLFHGIISNPSSEYLDMLSRMADFLHSLMGPQRSLAFLSDDDGGRWFHPYGARDEFGRATLATCATLLGRDRWTFDAEDLYPQAAWWLGHTVGSMHKQYGSRLFPESGLAVMESPTGRVIMDAGPFGPGRAGHSHSDSLSVVVSTSHQPILVDSGTYTYVGDPQLRNAFRGTSAHNTIRVDGRDQAIPAGPFWWENPPAVRVVSWHTADSDDQIIAECRYGEIIHRRVARFVKPDWILILDHVDGPAGEHEMEQFWHLASPEAHAHLHFGSPAQEFACSHSFVFGVKQPARCLVVKRKTSLPVTFAAAVAVIPNAKVNISEHPDGAVFSPVLPYHPDVRLAMVL